MPLLHLRGHSKGVAKFKRPRGLAIKHKSGPNGGLLQERRLPSLLPAIVDVTVLRHVPFRNGAYRDRRRGPLLLCEDQARSIEIRVPFSDYFTVRRLVHALPHDRVRARVREIVRVVLL